VEKQHGFRQQGGSKFEDVCRNPTFFKKRGEVEVAECFRIAQSGSAIQRAMDRGIICGQGLAKRT
jgi:hypothetical protein